MPCPVAAWLSAVAAPRPRRRGNEAAAAAAGGGGGAGNAAAAESAQGAENFRRGKCGKHDAINLPCGGWFIRP